MIKNELPKAERTTHAGGRRADWIDGEAMGHVLAALMPENCLAIEVAMATGLRISDVLGIKTDQLRDKKGELGNRSKNNSEGTKNGKKSTCLFAKRVEGQNDKKRRKILCF